MFGVTDSFYKTETEPKLPILSCYHKLAKSDFLRVGSVSWEPSEPVLLTCPLRISWSQSSVILKSSSWWRSEVWTEHKGNIEMSRHSDYFLLQILSEVEACLLSCLKN